LSSLSAKAPVRSAGRCISAAPTDDLLESLFAGDELFRADLAAP
jgi:hypothetical protein